MQPNVISTTAQSVYETATGTLDALVGYAFTPITFARTMAEQAYQTAQTMHVPSTHEVAVFGCTHLPRVQQFLARFIRLDSENPILCFSAPIIRDGEELARIDLPYYSDVVRKISRTPSPCSTPEIEAHLSQFEKDLHRFTQVMLDDVELTSEQRADLLGDWSADISRAAPVAPAFVKLVLSAFNQRFAEYNYQFWSQFVEGCKYKGQPILFFRNLQTLPESKLQLSRNGSVVKLFSSIPMQSIPTDAALMRDAQDTSIDILYSATLTCDFSLPASDPNFIKHDVNIQHRNPDFTATISNPQAFARDRVRLA